MTIEIKSTNQFIIQCNKNEIDIISAALFFAYENNAKHKNFGSQLFEQTHVAITSVERFLESLDIVIPGELNPHIQGENS